MGDFEAQEQGQASPSGPHLVQQIPGLKTAAGSAGARGGDLPCGLWEPLGAATWRKEEGRLLLGLEGQRVQEPGVLIPGPFFLRALVCTLVSTLLLPQP